jgi:PAS domain S-box-containing protein
VIPLNPAQPHPGNMTDLGKTSFVGPRLSSYFLRYGFAFFTVAAAFLLVFVFAHFNLSRPFAAFILSAIAVTFWYAGTGPGILSVVLSIWIRSYFFGPETPPVARVLYDLVFVSFGILMFWVRRGKNELAMKVAERTATLVATNEKLRQSEAYLEETQRLSHTGSFVWDISTQEALFLSDEWFRIYGFDREKENRAWEERRKRVHPEDLLKWETAVQRAIAEKAGYDLEYRIVLPSGLRKNLHVIGHPILNDAGRVVQFAGSVTDITDRTRSQEALRRSEAYLLEAQRLSRTGSWTHDLSSGLVTTSPEALRIFGAQPGDDTSRIEFFFNRIHPDDRDAERRNYEQARLAKSDFVSDYRIVLPDGRIRWLHGVGHPIFNESGQIVKFFGTTMDVTPQRESRVELEMAFDEIKRLKDHLHDENLALREQIDQAFMFEEIVGSSPALQTALTAVLKVAPTDSTVLITGETGTGKELLARAIHRRSHRASRAFISVNCASIPSTLIASELFGHEKGAFTGALQRRQGRFELAHSGTIFLDEIGELPAEAQIALLRVLQERQFERVGGNQALSTDVRIIAATNRDLPGSVAAGSFRPDLFYRLNVFPIEVPALRQRKEDVPMLLEYFVKRYAEKMGKQIRRIDKNTLEHCQAYHWPGNIRELQNIVERSVILCSGDTFWVDEAWFSQPDSPRLEISSPLTETLQSQERDLIEVALTESKGKVAGPDGAAARLGIPRSTLERKIKQLRIQKHKFLSPV